MSNAPGPAQALYAAYMSVMGEPPQPWADLDERLQRALESGADGAITAHQGTLPRPGDDPRGIPVWFRFADIDIRATCECGWTATGDSARDAFSAWWKHRHDAHPTAI